MEKLGPNDNPDVTKSEYLLETVATTKEVHLDQLVLQRRQYSLLHPRISVELSSYPDADGTTYSMVLGKPLKSADLKDLLAQGPNSEEQALNVDLSLISDLLKIPDDTNFLFSIAAGLKTHDDAWKDLGDGRSYAKSLSEQLTGKVTNLTLYDSAKNILRLMREQPSLWTTEVIRTEGLSNDSLFNRFLKMPPPIRRRIMENDLQRFEDVHEEQKRRILQTSGIRFEGRLRDEVWYLTGGEGNAEQTGDNIIEIKSDTFGAQVVLGNDGFKIYPRQDKFLIPVVTWKNVNGKREFQPPSSRIVKRDLVVYPRSNRIAQIVYQVKDWQVSNMAVGMLSMRYLTGNSEEDLNRSDMLLKAEELI